MTLPDRRLRLVHDHGEIEDCILRLRGFLALPDQMATELTLFVRGRIHRAHAATLRHHVRLLWEGEKLSSLNGAYQLVNGPINPAIFARYQSSRIRPAWNGRVGDGDSELRSAVYIDIDPIRPNRPNPTSAKCTSTPDMSWEATCGARPLVRHESSPLGGTFDSFIWRTLLQPNSAGCR
jgi:hypothetical protein